MLNTCTDGTPSGTLLDLTYGWNAGSGDNGNLRGFTAAGQQVFNRTYGYDALNRLASMSDSDTVASCQGATWSYDPWGNRTAQTPTKGSCGMWSSSYTGNNQISGYSYDAAGNLLNDGSHSYTYDAENRINAVNGGSTATYVYDADGKRVSKKVSAVESDYIFDPSGNPMTIFSSGCGNCWASGFVFANGRQIAEYENSSTYFITTDQLGSTRLMTAMNKSVYDSMDYMPFGEQVAGGTGTTLKFTGKERDSESNLDNFGARYFTSQMGRFMSPDPSSVTGDLVDSESPQSWNMYSYVLNNPLSATDPDGLDCIYINNDTGQYEGFNRGDCDNSTPEKANSGYYVNGTVDTISTTTGDTSGVVTGYTGTSDSGGLIVGTFGGAPPSNPNTNSDALNPFAQGVFSQLNQMPITGFIFGVYGAGAAIGATGGTICYLNPSCLGALDLPTLGDLSPAAESATPGEVSELSQAASKGRPSVEKALRSFQRRLAEHQADLARYQSEGSYTSKTTSEIKHFQTMIRLAQDWLSKNP